MGNPSRQKKEKPEKSGFFYVRNDSLSDWLMYPPNAKDYRVKLRIFCESMVAEAEQFQ